MLSVENKNESSVFGNYLAIVLPSFIIGRNITCYMWLKKIKKFFILTFIISLKTFSQSKPVSKYCIIFFLSLLKEIF